MEQNSLQHVGVLGMRWGHRKYKNSDGSYNDAGKQQIVKDLKKDYKKNSSYSQPYKTSKQYAAAADELVKNSKNITKQDINELRTLKKQWFEASKESEAQISKMDDIARNLAKETYKKELKKNPDYYDNERFKEKLFESILYDDDNSGYALARKQNSQLTKQINDTDKLFDDYQNKRIDMGKKVLGKYGDTILQKDKWSQYTISDSLIDSVSRLYDSDITYKR